MVLYHLAWHIVRAPFADRTASIKQTKANVASGVSKLTMGNQLIATVLQDRVLMPQTYMYPVVSRSVHLSCRVALCDESSFCLHVSNTCFVRELEMRSHIFQNLFTNIIIMWEAIFYKSRCHFVFSKEILNNAMYKQE